MNTETPKPQDPNSLPEQAELIADMNRSRLYNNSLRKGIVDKLSDLVNSIESTKIEDMSPRDRESLTTIVNSMGSLMKDVEGSTERVLKAVSSLKNDEANQDVSNMVVEYLKQKRKMMADNKLSEPVQEVEDPNVADKALAERFSESGLEISEDELVIAIPKMNNNDVKKEEEQTEE